MEWKENTKTMKATKNEETAGLNSKLELHRTAKKHKEFNMFVGVIN